MVPGGRGLMRVCVTEREDGEDGRKEVRVEEKEEGEVMEEMKTQRGMEEGKKQMGHGAADGLRRFLSPHRLFTCGRPKLLEEPANRGEQKPAREPRPHCVTTNHLRGRNASSSRPATLRSADPLTNEPARDVNSRKCLHTVDQPFPVVSVSPVKQQQQIVPGPTRSHQQEHVGNIQARGGACRAAGCQDMMCKFCCGKISVVVYSSSTPESALITKSSGTSSSFQVDVFVFYLYGSSSSSS
ncbi:unnamed protein product [Pleuronectes platessa]|uniref:Uncharacterized protein n=1 Tax=Pleuronectes platessa TaxID=8262 RepID=A0A9N7UZS0_PLEPL|nr:unnamed protein product [Pleuronectes platessa]